VIDSEGQRNPQAEPKPTILFVEDDAGVRLITERILRRGGYDLLVATNGQNALELARDHDGPIAMLLTDINMPELSGQELSSQLTAERPGLRVIFISGYTSDVVDLAGSDVYFLGKPYMPKELLEKVREVLSP